MLALITGGSKGIGKSISNYLHKKNYTVITVGQFNNATEMGDINDINFRNTLVANWKPDIFINNAGIAKEEFNKVLNTNGLAAVDLLQKFYQKMDNGHIINIGSLATTQNGYQVKDMENTSYILSKKLLHSASYFLQEMHIKPIRVTSLELGAVNTSIKNRFYNKEISENEYEEQTLRSIPMKTDDVVNAIDWILNLPKHLEVRNIQLNNFVKPNGKRK
jgi:NADP-dependent 3-hydroxy acid dehydrogenase YdfG